MGLGDFSLAGKLFGGGSGSSVKDHIQGALDPLDLAGFKKRRQARELSRIEEKRARLQLMRGNIEQVRRAQIARSQILQMGANQGAQQSSGVAGGAGSATSQAFSNVGFANQIFELNRQAGFRMRNIAELQQQTQLGMTVGSFFLGGFGGAAAGGAASGAVGSGGLQVGGSASSGSSLGTPKGTAGFKGPF